MKLSTESLLKLPTAKKVIILVVILCAVTGLYFFLFFTPRNDELQMQKEELGRQIKELNETKRITQDLERFKKQIARLDEELKSALTQLPNEKEIPEILKNISSLGKESNLEFTLFRPKARGGRPSTRRRAAAWATRPPLGSGSAGQSPRPASGSPRRRRWS